jgi:hypothetical protein
VAGDVVPRASLFGDPVDAVLDVVLDRRVVDVASLRLRGDFSPYAEQGEPVVVRRDAGPLTRIRYRLPLQCLELACLPPDTGAGGRRTFTLGPLRVEFAREGGGKGGTTVVLPQIEVASRLTPGEAARITPIDQPPFHATVTVPPPAYAVSPTLLLWLLGGGAAVLLAAAGLMLVHVLRRRDDGLAPEPAPPPEPVRVLTPLERALLLLERARERGPIEDRRKALERLAAELRRSGERELAGSATELAWAEQPPQNDATRALEEAVRRRIAEGVNGRAPVEA